MKHQPTALFILSLLLPLVVARTISATSTFRATGVASFKPGRARLLKYSRGKNPRGPQIIFSLFAPSSQGSH